MQLVKRKLKEKQSEATTYNPERTRAALLAAAFAEVYRCGFRGTDLGAILASAGVTKGALYYHFKNKDALGYALVDELIMGITEDKWLRPLRRQVNPIDALVAIIESRATERNEASCGCPLNNLAQEMSPIDEGFRERLARVFEAWRNGIAAAFRDGQARNLVRPDIDPDSTAWYVIATFEGGLSLAKNSQDLEVLRSVKAQLVRFLESLRMPKGRLKSESSQLQFSL
jgi:AcrR family transcriptional regulator